MAILTILKEGDETLRKHSRRVETITPHILTLLDDMTETLHAVAGVGLAAPQVGVLRRVVVIDVGEGVIELINPVIEKVEGGIEDVEACLSIPGQYGLVERPEFVRVKAQDRRGKPITVKGEGLLARALCHEIDHLDGILYRDKAKRMLTREEAAELK